MMGMYKTLDYFGIERCQECKCAIGDDWEYKDFSNKSVVICPQCKTEIILVEVENK